MNWCQGDGFSSVDAQTGANKLVFRIGGANFLHCLVTDSISLERERAESLITK